MATTFKRKNLYILLAISFLTLSLSSCAYSSPIGSYDFYIENVLQENLTLSIFNTASIKMYNDIQTNYSESKLKWYRTTSKRQRIDEKTGETITYVYDPIILYLDGNEDITWTFILEKNGNLLEVTKTSYSIPRLFVRK